VYDLLAVRIITDTVKGLLRSLGTHSQPVEARSGRIKDFIAIPRPNMYQSLHTSVIGPHGQPFEIQIRTMEMHRVAEEGIAAHWKYKTGKPVGQQGRSAVPLVAASGGMAAGDAGPKRLSEYAEDRSLSRRGLCVYPERARSSSCPRDASPVDFAYAIHTEVGNKCIGAKVNGRIVPLKSRLKNGDIVEIQTQAGHTPSRDWLSFVKTSRARNKIRHYINVSQRERSIEIGKKILEKEARKFKLNLKKLVDEGLLLKAAPDYGCTKLEDVYSALGFGKISARVLLGKLVAPGELQKLPDEKSRSLLRPSRKCLGLHPAPRFK
jgi:GTP pyrophosphokinase